MPQGFDTGWTRIKKGMNADITHSLREAICIIRVHPWISVLFPLR